jgi:hypothetical protein
LSRCLVENHGTLSSGGQTTIDGEPAAVILDKGDTAGATPSKVFVAATGTPLPVRWAALGAQRPGAMKDARCSSHSSPTHSGDALSFGRYDRVPNLAPPHGAMDSTQLTGG